MAKYTKEVILQMAEEEDVEFIRLQFTDMFGMMKNMAITAGQLEKALNNQCVFDGSSFEGFVTIEEADMFLHPDLDTFAILPQQGKVARLICDVYDREGNLYAKSSRTILQKVIFEAKAMGYEFEISPECEFFLFHTDEDGGATSVTHDKGGYLDLGPLDLGENARRDMVLTLEEMGIDVESSFHEVAAGQHELDFCPAAALRTADQLMTAKFAIRTIAKRHGLHATFMPKPKTGVHGSGLHLSFSLFQEGKDVFADKSDEYGLSKEAYYFMGGLMKHISGIAAITNPLVNSYKRLTPGYGAPIYVAWSAKNRSPLIRIPLTGDGIMAIELRCPDSAANPYLALAVCMAAGLDGIKQKIVPPSPVDRNISDLTEEERNAMQITLLPGSLGEAVAELKKDDFLCQVLGQEFVDGYINAKEEEWHEYLRQVSDWETEKYLYRI